MSRLLDVILELKRDLKRDWKDDLDRIGIWEDVQPLYTKWKGETANRVLAFIVLAYDNQSGWIELHKDRQENKERIMHRLGGKAGDKVLKSVLDGSSEAAEEVTDWFLNWQKDWRWQSILTCFQYHADVMRFAGSRTSDKRFSGLTEENKEIFTDIGEDKLSAINLQKSKAIEQAIERRRQGEQLLEEIRRDFVTVDTALQKEGKAKLTDSADIMSHERFISRRNAERGTATRS